MINYVYANAERAWQRKQNPGLIKMRRRTEACSMLFTSMGNHFLLDWLDRQLVEMSRNATDEQVQQRLKSVLAAARGTCTSTAATSTLTTPSAVTTVSPYALFAPPSNYSLAQVRWLAGEGLLTAAMVRQCYASPRNTTRCNSLMLALANMKGVLR